MKFNEMLRELRKKAELTQEQLADKADVPIGTLRNLEQGNRSPNWVILARLCRAMGVSMDEFSKCDEAKEAKKATRRNK